MKFRKVRLILFRAKLEEIGFYKGVTFQERAVERKVKKVIAEWLFNLERYKGIRVVRFRKLFSKLNEIVFPIKIKKCYGSNLDIVIADNKGNEYYMSKRNIYCYNDVENYIIGRRNSVLEPLVDREFYYKISKNGAIELQESSAMKLKPDGKNDDVAVVFCNNSKKNITNVTLNLYTYNIEMKIQYPTMGKEFDKKILKFLFSVNEFLEEKD